MSTTRTPKVSERVAPKAADPQPAKKKGGDHDDDGPDFRTLLHAWLESHRASLADSRYWHTNSAIRAINAMAARPKR